MPVQITQSNPVSLTDIALNNRNFEAQERQRGVANEQRQQSLDQGTQRLRLTQQQLELAAKKQNMTADQFGQKIAFEVVNTSADADDAIARLNIALPEVSPEAEQNIRNLPPTAFGSGRPTAIQDRENLQSTFSEEERAAADRIKARLEPGAGTEKPPQITMIGDVPHIFDSSTKTMTPVKVGGVEQTPQVVASNAGTVSAGTAAGKQAIEASGDARKSLSTIKSNIAKYDEAIQLIDEGANTGRIASTLPSVQAASVELDNVQRQLGLNVIEQVTFGALSEGELQLALDTALPTNLQPQALKQWLLEKKESQEKLAQELESAAIFLGTPGNTVAEYMDLMRRVRETDAVSTGGEATVGRFKVRTK